MDDKDKLTKLVKYLLRNHIIEAPELAKVLGYDLKTFIKKYL